MPTPVPWRAIIEAALDENPVIRIGSVVKTYLGRTPTRSEITSARRAALRYAAAGHAEVAHLPATTVPPSEDRLLLVWPGTDTGDVARLRAAVEHTRLPGKVRRPAAVSAAAARALAAGVTDSARAVVDVEVDRLDTVTAVAVADELDAAVRELRGFRRALRVHVERLSEDAGLSKEHAELLGTVSRGRPRKQRRRK